MLKNKNILALSWWPRGPELLLTKLWKGAVMWWGGTCYLRSPINNRRTTYSHWKDRSLFFSLNKKCWPWVSKLVMSGLMYLILLTFLFQLHDDTVGLAINFALERESKGETGRSNAGLICFFQESRIALSHRSPLTSSLRRAPWARTGSQGLSGCTEWWTSKDAALQAVEWKAQMDRRFGRGLSVAT